MKKDRDTIDEMLHSKLYDFEVEVSPDNWEAIEKRLPHPSIQPAQRKWYYWAAAAVTAIAIVSSGLLWKETNEQTKVFDQEQQLVYENPHDSVAVPQGQDNAKDAGKKELIAKLIVKQPATNGPAASAKRMESQPVLKEEEKPEICDDTNDEAASESGKQEQTAFSFSTHQVASPQIHEEKGDKEAAPEKTEVHRKRKWGVGMGVGNLSTASNSGGFFRPSYSDAQAYGTSSLLRGNATYLTSVPVQEPKKQNVKHKPPLTFGVSASYKLGEKWSLQSGLLYSYMASEWDTNEKVNTENKQKLHFIGVPVSVAYKLAEWKRIQFYVSAGAKVEIGVGGQIRTDIYSSSNEKLKTLTEKKRMKEPYFSVNGHIGASYPLLRFLSAYAEVGTDYYFDNGSDIETFHSDKPLNIGLQIGLRFGL